MKFAFAIVIFVHWSTLSTADDISLDFLDHVNKSYLQCKDDMLSVNFSNSVISEIGPNFISSSLITCLDLAGNKINYIAEGAFSKLPKLTHLYLSNNIIKDPFAFGRHQTLKVLVLNNAYYDNNNCYYNKHYVKISGDYYPNLEMLSARYNCIGDLSSSEQILYFQNSTLSTPSIQKIPFSKLKILDLSNNYISSSTFVDLLPKSLTHLYLQNNRLDSLTSLKNGNELTILTLDNNKLRYIGKFSYNTNSSGLWLSSLKNLRHLSVSRNEINTIESVAFQDTIKLTHLNLSVNEINYLYPETFTKLQFLKTLDLSYNEFQKIPEISNEINITALFLSCNQIKKITGYAFAQMPKLKELSLNGNHIDEVNINGFFKLFYLENLDLSNNMLSSLPKKWTGAFRSLKYLDLRNNQFISLESLSLTNTLPLVEVYLAMNPLKYLDAESFKSLPQNATVNLVEE